MSAVLILNVLWQVSVLAMVTLGLAIVFGQLKIMNMAHGELVMIGAYAPVITANMGLPAIFQVPVCILTVALTALVLERTIVRHFYARPFDSLLATWGISILLREIVELIFGRGYQSVASPLPGTMSVFGTDYPVYRVVVMLGILAFFVVLALWYRRSSIGTKIKAMVENPELARACGINTDRLSTICFVFGAVTAGIAGMVLAPTIRIEPMMGLDYLVRSFFSLVVGGLGSLEGLFVGVGIIGGTQSVFSALFNQTYGYLFILFLSIVFLWLRPHGIHRAR
ncbi:branched-chain amino acid ABC transporter permease [Hoeflea prorocentri]|uniref:Branched-chain amino acid ABC transporter permease n=1 Tax=Hoeflea prorocentri TaxID=1922333 RepID=A0A9X3ZK71_9HYPH|nr:branched-chain amino acid ABC transporter permease [Hoeflea prorocentri]MCY6383595.1 branched-chain amino acid ABC transporter permease [Hoeflea prorocentri]MDA5401395.1 branched-chain amino acid ABC transporter permease [Hoeflea prorocentri]